MELKNNRLLIVDDDPLVREAYQSILEKQPDLLNQMGAFIFSESFDTEKFPAANQYALSYCENGVKAIQQVKTAVGAHQPFAVAFIDMRMPGLNGAETARQLWEIDPNLKIVIVTAFSDISSSEITQIIGRNDIFFIRKPFHPVEIELFARSLTQQWTLEREQEKLQHELEQVNVHLADRVAEQTVALQHAHRLLKILDREKYHFIQYIAHEINTPLNYIGAKELIDLEKLTEDEQQFMDMIDQGYRRLRDLVKNALHYFSIADIDFQTQKTTILLPKLIHTAISFYQPEIDKQKLFFEVNLNGLQHIEADLQYANMLIKILFENAIHFSSVGGRVSIIGGTIDHPHQLRIINAGKGIEPADLENIFIAFTIEEHKRRPGGYGFNLPIAKHICEAHGWQIRAESAGINHGAQFIVDFKS